MMAAQTGASGNDVESIWRELSRGINDVYAHRELSSQRFMQLYTHVYNYCTRNPNGSDTSGGGSRRTSRLQRPRSSGPSASNATVSSRFVGHDLYFRIRDLLKAHLIALAKNGKDKMGENLVAFYLAEWERYTISSKLMNGFCSYMNRHWIRRELDEGHEDIHQIYHLALDIWKETFFEPLHAPVTAIATVLQLINRERNGETVNTSFIKGMTDSLVELGKDRNREEIPQNQNHTDDLGIYQRRFEDPFIQETETFYTNESTSFLQSGKTVPEYMKKSEQRLKDERRRVTVYLHSSTMERLMKCCESVLIEKQLSVLHDEFPVLLKAQERDDMSRMYDLVSKLGDSFGNMRDILQAHIAAEGEAAISEKISVINKEPKEYIKTILEVYQKFQALVSTAFKQDPGFVASLDQACGIFINKNELTREPKGSYRTPDMLARYCDILLKSKKYDDRELEDLLDQAMIIFKFIDDKDVFQKRYSQYLANRLVANLSASDDAESSMIQKLKVACGFEYTTKLQRMYQDVAIARDMNEDLKKWLSRQQVADPMKVDFYCMILSSGSWPFAPDANDTFLLPQVLEPCVNIFMHFYGEMHTGRRVNWLYSKSKGEVVANCFSKKYTFVMSTYGIGILLQYNDKDSYKLHELAEATQLREDIVTQVVQIFMQSSILKSTDAEDKLSFNSVIELRKDYESKKLKINLVGPLKTDVKLEDEKIQTSIEQGRQHEVEAAIVRIMKSRKVMDHQLLLSEVITQVMSRFTPTVSLIKRCIDHLIEREYLKRKEDEQNIYEYVS